MSFYFMGDGRNCFGHSASINSVHFQRDSQFIWTASSDKSARSFRVSSGGANKTLQSHIRGISTVSASCDGRLVLTGGADSAAVLTWTQQSASQAPLHIIAHDSALTCVAFTPGDEGVITCSDDGGVMLWRVDGLIKLPRIKNFEMQNQMFEEEYYEYQSLLKEHKDVCRRCSVCISSTKELLQWNHPGLIKRDKVPSFLVSATAHDSVAPPVAAADCARIKKNVCGIQRLQFFGGKKNIACAAGRPGVALLRMGD
jgi:WD40 repeat protein